MDNEVIQVTEYQLITWQCIGIFAPHDAYCGKPLETWLHRFDATPHTVICPRCKQAYWVIPPKNENELAQVEKR